VLLEDLDHLGVGRGVGVALGPRLHRSDGLGVTKHAPTVGTRPLAARLVPVGLVVPVVVEAIHWVAQALRKANLLTRDLGSVWCVLSRTWGSEWNRVVSQQSLNHDAASPRQRMVRAVKYVEMIRNNQSVNQVIHAYCWSRPSLAQNNTLSTCMA
jgi:hypothetical protein